MKGSECRLIEYMEGSKKRFIIPVYQRNYDWKTENCKQLYDDLIRVIKDKRKSHFFGSIVSVYEPSGRNTEFLVIDGQQRLTTVSLLFLAMYNLIKDGANLVLSSEDKKKRFMKHSLDAKNLYTLCNGILEQYYKDKVLFIISVRSFISKITNDNKLDVSEINRNVGIMLEQSIREDELINLGELSRGNSLELLSDTMLNKLRSLKDKNVAAEILSRAIKSTINDIGKINLTLQEKFSTKFNKLVDAYNERTDIADIEKIIEEMIKLKKEIEDELEKGNEYDLSPEEKAFFDALGADPEIKELMQDETLVQIAKELVDIINENLTLDAFKREDARARIRVNIKRLLIKYNYPPIKRDGAVEQVIRQAELKYQEI